MRDLSEIRLKINEIDDKMRVLFEERMNAVREVAEYKKANGLPILDTERERDLLEMNAVKIEDESLRPYYVSFLESNMANSRRYQDMLINGIKIAYSGAMGAFAYIATCKLFPNASRIAYPNFEAAYTACAQGECDIAVLPIENSVGGEVGAVSDLMFSGPLKVNGVVEIDVAHCLLGKPGSVRSEIREVVSHPQALAQCRPYIREHGFSEREYENTALAAEFVSKGDDPTVAAIASAEAASIFGLDILEKNINESRSNTTRVAVFSRSEHKHEKSDTGVHSILLFTVKNEAGSLAKALDIIGKHGFNMRVLRSRPMKSLMWQYYFYIEIEGNANSKEGKRMIEDLEEFCDKIKIVGSYVN